MPVCDMEGCSTRTRSHGTLCAYHRIVRRVEIVNANAARRAAMVSDKDTRITVLEAKLKVAVEGVAEMVRDAEIGTLRDIKRTGHKVLGVLTHGEKGFLE